MKSLTEQVGKAWARWQRDDDAKTYSEWSRLQRVVNELKAVTVLFVCLAIFGAHCLFDCLTLTTPHLAYAINFMLLAACTAVGAAVFYLEMTHTLYYTRLQTLLGKHGVSTPAAFAEFVMRRCADHAGGGSLYGLRPAALVTRVFLRVDSGALRNVQKILDENALLPYQ